jgi:hypothetical protein
MSISVYGDVNQCISLNLGQQFPDETVAKEIFTANGKKARLHRQWAQSRKEGRRG